MTVTTNTKTTKTPTEILAATRRAELADAMTFLETTTASDTSSAEIVRTIEGQWSTGNAASSSIDWRLATDEAHRQTVLERGAAQRVKVLQGRQINEDRELAEMLLPTIQKAYPVGSFSVDTIEADKGPDATPHISVIQLAATRHHDSGTLLGTIEVFLYRDEMQAPLTTERLKTFLADDGIGVSVGSGYDQVWTSPSGDGFVDQARIEVNSAYPAVPIVQNLASASSVESFGRSLAHSLQDRFASHTAAGNKQIRVPVQASGMVGDSRIVDGDRHVTVKLDLLAKANANMSADIDSAIGVLASNLPGSAHGGLGRVTSANLVGVHPWIDMYGKVGGREIGVDVVFVSRAA